MNVELVTNDEPEGEEFFIFLRMMAIKGFYEIFEYIVKNGAADYRMISRCILKKKLVKENRITIILHALANMGMIECVSLDGMENYVLTDFGEKVSKGLIATKRTFQDK